MLPVLNYSWDCLLNKKGLIKIGKVLYCFQKDAQVAVLDGQMKTFNNFIEASSAKENSLVRIFPLQHLKSTTPTNYGIVKSNGLKIGSKRLSIAFMWEPIMEQVLNINNQWVWVQRGNKYHVWFHSETYTIAWWNDNRTIFQYKHQGTDIGGNYDSREGAYYNRVTDMTPDNLITLNTETLANYYIDIYVAIFSLAYNGEYSSYPGPTIYFYSCYGTCNALGTLNQVPLTIN